MSARKGLSSRLRHRMTLQEEIRTADSYGGYARSWQDVCTLWAEIIPLQSLNRRSETMETGQIQATVTHKITLRYRSQITPGQRLTFEGRAFNIRSVINTHEDHRSLEILAEEGGPA